VIDRFHVVKALNEAVDAVRKEEWRSLEGDEKKAIKGLRWLLGSKLCKSGCGWAATELT
jgi:transposase